MQHDELRELTGAYALDAVSDRERREMERHLEACPACAEEVRSLRATAAELAAAVPLRRPPDTLRARVLAAAVEGPLSPAAHAVRTSGAAPDVAWWLAAAAALVALAASTYALTLRSRVGRLESELRVARLQADSAQQQLAQAQADIRLVNASAGILASPDVVRVDLKGRGRAPDATGRAFWSRSRGVLFTAASLPPPLVAGVSALGRDGCRPAERRTPRAKRGGHDDDGGQRQRGGADGVRGHDRARRRCGEADAGRDGAARRPVVSAAPRPLGSADSSRRSSQVSGSENP